MIDPFCGAGTVLAMANAFLVEGGKKLEVEKIARLGCLNKGSADHAKQQQQRQQQQKQQQKQNQNKNKNNPSTPLGSRSFKTLLQSTRRWSRTPP